MTTRMIKTCSQHLRFQVNLKELIFCNKNNYLMLPEIFEYFYGVI